jgi:hypothetical protein
MVAEEVYMPNKDSEPSPRQLVWGLALMAAGVGVFMALPARMAQIATLRRAEPYSLDMLFLWFCFGMLGVLLVAGGARKIWAWFHKTHR